MEMFFNGLVNQQVWLLVLFGLLVWSERHLVSHVGASWLYRMCAALPLLLVLFNLPAELKPSQLSVVYIHQVSTMMSDSLGQGHNSNVMFGLNAVYWGVLSLLVGVVITYHRQFYASLRLTSNSQATQDLCMVMPGLTASKVMFSDNVSSPLVAGFFNKKLVLPTDHQTRFEHDALRLVIEHELVHLKRNDNIVNMFALMITLVNWFNPLAWMAYGSFRRLQELSIDERVLAQKSKQQKLIYSKAIVACVANSRPQMLAYSHYGDKSMMLQRLKQIQLLGHKSKATKAAVLGVLLALVGTAAIAQQPLVAGATKSGAAENARPVIRIEPTYPKEAAANGVTGSVVLKFDITADGKTSNINVISSKPEVIFDEAAAEALSKWEYTRSTKGFKDMLVQLDFVLASQQDHYQHVEQIKVKG